MNAMMKELRDAREARAGPRPIPLDPFQAKGSLADDSHSAIVIDGDGAGAGGASARSTAAGRNSAAKAGTDGASSSHSAAGAGAGEASEKSTAVDRHSAASQGVDPLHRIWLSGVADNDAPKDATEVDCRLWDSAFKAESAGSRIFTLDRFRVRV